MTTTATTTQVYRVHIKAPADKIWRLTHEIRELPDGTCSLTVTHELDGMPKTAAMVAGEGESQGAGGGHAWVLSDLKSLLETGSPLAARSGSSAN